MDRASRLCTVSVMKIFTDAWEPTTADIIRMFTRDWMTHNPAPKWLMADSALYYVSEEMREFCGKSGMGLLIAPPECHWLMSHEEQLTGRLKATVDLDTAQGEVRVPPARPRRDGGDYWEVQGEWLVRVHVNPRLAMLIPSKTKNIALPEDSLSGERRTITRSGNNEQVINDNFRTHKNPARCMLDRWTGETR